jgi:hypothetical protein
MGGGEEGEGVGGGKPDTAARIQTYYLLLTLN